MRGYSSAGPNALVTGAATGIGKACAEVLAREGYFVIAADINTKVFDVANQIGGVAYTCDLGEEREVEKMFSAIDKNYGPLTTLVNNAGIAIPCDFLDVSIEDFDRVLNVNLRGAFLATQHAARMMIRSEIKGAIVNMSSVNAVVSIPSVASYSISKGGIMQLTKSAALALAPYGIRVNAVGPGSVDTAMMAGVNANAAALGIAMSRTPLKRMASPEEIAEVVSFLVSMKASYITGETVYVDGGRLALNYTC